MLRQLLSTFSGSSAFVVIDTCFSGTLLNETINTPNISSHSASLQILAAAGSGQTIYDGGILGHSLMSGELIDILKNVDGSITIKEIKERIEPIVSEISRFIGYPQTPQLKIIANKASRFTIHRY
jgi:hypothetical protein